MSGIDRHLILASNRGPFDFVSTEDGFERQRGSGGLVTVLSPVGRYAAPTWISAARSEADRQISQQHGDEPISIEEDGAQYALRLIDIPASVYEGYYHVIANPLLWFVHHYMWDTPREPTLGPAEWAAWRDGYVPANRQFAQAISAEINRNSSPAVVMIQDYQLYLVAGMLRATHPDIPIQFFLHIPFPASDYLRCVLPQAMREAMLRSLLSCDIVGFQTKRSATNFVRAARSFVPETRVNEDAGIVEHAGRRTLARVYPVSVDPQYLRELAHSEQAERELDFLAPAFGEQTIVRVDRIEPSKNIVRGFEAFDLLLEQHPELKGRVRFLACLIPPRPGVPEYERYDEEIAVAINRVNRRHGTPRWRPIEAFVDNNYVRALAAMRRYDVLLVNPLIDGMNIVSKEGVSVNEVDGVLVLSEGAGTFEQFSPLLPTCVGALDVVGTAEALFTALTMPRDQRRQVAAALRAQVEEHDAVAWLDAQLHDLAAL